MVANIPYDWDVFQIAIICNETFMSNFIRGLSMTSLLLAT